MILLAGGVVTARHFMKAAEDDQPEWMPDFDQKLFGAAAELAAARTQY